MTRTILDKTLVDFVTLVQVLFTANKMELDYYHQEVNVRIVS